jgi:type I restriction enzyme M protein
MVANTTELEKRLWEAADNLRANSKLRSSQYSVPVLGLIFLRFADDRFEQASERLRGTGSRRRGIDKTDYQAEGAMYLPDDARWQYLLDLPESENIGRAINDAMEAIMQENNELRGVLPKQYHRFENDVLVSLLKTFNFNLEDLEGDVFGQIYEYFLGNFAMTEGQKGGEFFTPTSIVRLIVEIIEPYHGKIFDPACGSGGMFVQSAAFVERHQGNPTQEISIYGQERVRETVRLAKMNLAVHGLTGDIREDNTYYVDVHRSVDTFDFVMANPPFNVDSVDKGKLKTDPRFPFGLPNVDNANYLWIQMFYSALNESGRAGFVMANSASDARHSEMEIRKQLVDSGAVDVMITIGSNFFYTVTLPCTLWFLDKGAIGTEREDTVLFIDARDTYRQIDRAHRDFAPEQLEFIANIVRLYRGKAVETLNGSDELLTEHFSDGNYADIAGLCKVATRAEIAEQGYSLNAGRYVGVQAREGMADFEFQQRMTELHEQLELLNAEAHDLEDRIAYNMKKLLGGE